MKKSFRTLPLICWLCVIVATAVIYALVVEDMFSYTERWASVIFVLLGEILLCVKYAFGKYSSILNTHGISGLMYTVIAFVLSLVYINATDPNITWFFVIHIILLTALIVIDLTIANVEARASFSDNSIAASQNAISQCCSSAQRIAYENKGSEHDGELNAIYESLKYADNTICSGDERAIFEKLESLGYSLKNNENPDVINARIKEIKELINARNTCVKQNKRGSF